jgi:hypothetical protein
MLDQEEPNWAEISRLCEMAHASLVVRGIGAVEASVARELERALEGLPAESNAIVHAEALALLHHLRGNAEAALFYREREVALWRQLDESLLRDPPREDTLIEIRKRRSSSALKERYMVIEELRAQISSNGS